MKKTLLVISLLSIACTSTIDRSGEWGKTAFYQVGDYYFEHPVNSLIGNGQISFGDCKVEFDEGDFLAERPADKERQKDGVNYQAWYQDNILVTYTADVQEFGYYFTINNGGADVGSCVGFVERLASTFGDKKRYFNQRFDFRVDLPDEYRVSYFEGGSGVALKKEMTVEGEEGPINYNAEIVILPFENLERFEDLNQFIRTKYPDFSNEFVNFAGVSGFYVDEGLGTDSIKHFFTMLDGERYIFEAYLKVPSLYYNTHLAEFESVVRSLTFY